MPCHLIHSGVGGRTIAEFRARLATHKVMASETLSPKKQKVPDFWGPYSAALATGCTNLIICPNWLAGKLSWWHMPANLSSGEAEAGDSHFQI